MDQGVIEKTKKLYKRSLLRELLLKKDDTKFQDLLDANEDPSQRKEQIERQKPINKLVKDIKLKDSIFKIASSWDELTEHNLKNAWNKILRDDDTFEHTRKLTPSTLLSENW